MPPVILKDGSQILLTTITENLRHIDYNHVVEIARDFTIYSTGEGIGDKLKQFNLRETDEAFEQRKRLSQMNTPDLVNAVRKPLEKVPRTPANVIMSWNDKDSRTSNENKKKLLDIGAKFWGEKSFEKYISKRLPELDSTDPNSFIVIESKEKYNPKDSKSERNKPYPFEVNSAEAINYQYVNNILQWLIVLNYIMMVDKDGKYSQGEIYYMYLGNETIRATEIHNTMVDTYISINSGIPIIRSCDEVINYGCICDAWPTLFQFGQDPDKSRFFTLEVIPHNMGRVPAKRVGTLTDPVTRDRTCVPIINPAKSYFEKSIKSMSEFDLTNCLHVFPRLIQYADACEGIRTEGAIIGCTKGLDPNGNKCRACGGTGFKGHTSAQDVIQIRMPRELSEVVSLENMLVYKSPPIDLLKFQQEFAFDKLRDASKKAVYNDNSLRTQVTKTATENEINLDDVYDTLMPFGDNYSDFYIWGYNCFAALHDLDKNITIKHIFPSDFKFQSLDSLLDELSKANNSGADSYVKIAINSKIISKMYIDHPSELLKIQTQQKYSPFPGRSESEIALIVSSNLTTKRNSVFYANYDYVFSEIEYQSSLRSLNFYEMDEAMQRNLITLQINSMITQMQNDASSDSAIQFGGTGATENPVDIEEQAKANLKGSVGGVQGILDIQASVAAGNTDRDAALAVLQTIYGFEISEAEAILGKPKPVKPILSVA